jgi:hypothetical protein
MRGHVHSIGWVDIRNGAKGKRRYAVSLAKVPIENI